MASHRHSPFRPSSDIHQSSAVDNEVQPPNARQGWTEEPVLTMIAFFVVHDGQIKIQIISDHCLRNHSPLIKILPCQRMLELRKHLSSLFPSAQAAEQFTPQARSRGRLEFAKVAMCPNDTRKAKEGNSISTFNSNNPIIRGAKNRVGGQSARGLG